MNNKIIKKLRLLKNIQPDDDFKESTRRIILATSPKVKIFSFPKFAFSATLAVAILAMAGLSIFSSNSPVLASFDEGDIQQEIQSISSTLEIEEIEYRQNINNTIASALTEVSSSKASHLNKSVIELEQSQINSLENDNKEEINDLLDKVIF